jgi:ABC-type lipoprotein export system ATPase subunit
MAPPVLQVRNLRAYYQMGIFGITREVRAVDDVTLDINSNEIYGLAGESSSGKTSFIKTIAAANRPPLNVVGGSVKYSFLDRDIHALDRRGLEAVRWKNISYVMQGSMSVLNPVRKVIHTFTDFAYRHVGKPMPEFLALVEGHLERLLLKPSVLNAFPHELSGGMRRYAGPSSSSPTSPPRRSMLWCRRRSWRSCARSSRKWGRRSSSSPMICRCMPTSPTDWGSCMPGGWSRRHPPRRSSRGLSTPTPSI